MFSGVWTTNVNVDYLRLFIQQHYEEPEERRVLMPSALTKTVMSLLDPRAVGMSITLITYIPYCAHTRLEDT
jgi:hypothetical protein